MAVTEIPARFQHVCDGCGASEYTASKSRPKYWSDFHILRDAYDYQGAAVADGSVKRCLCEACSDTAGKAINAAIEERRAILKAKETEDV